MSVNCKHIKAEGGIGAGDTGYFVCTARNKGLNEYECKTCMLRLPRQLKGFPNIPPEFESIFGKL